MFAGSGDNSCAGLLRQHITTDRVYPRIVLVEYVESADKFKKTEFKTLFKDTKIDARRAPCRSEVVSRPQRSPPPSYASTVKQMQRGSFPQAKTNSAAPERPKGGKIYLNQHGQRVDQGVKLDWAWRSSPSSITAADVELEPPRKNWVRGFRARHPEIAAKKLRPMDWARNDIYEKVAHWFTVIEREWSWFRGCSV
ncbi:uncharacterized protein A1O9_13127 [Exophiala aquamarina CBS 119918]|uniref:Uncharacterized protein n=1 Tax=Exophiala aquamarina CBS 119918 TaxID=1182545 RepID=A0A072NT95_9EURO|nr:uncharacterized protein A1O9_13127 [Exophiala aquamarina CBS 119918]KEF50821.1 hypothetical protein A1O9_13127 [Exophiala aquamarina CBS 119918]